MQICKKIDARYLIPTQKLVDGIIILQESAYILVAKVAKINQEGNPLNKLHTSYISFHAFSNLLET